MNGRERALRAVNHQEPDRIPVDMGGLLVTINAHTYPDLLRYLGLEDGGADAMISPEWSVVLKPAEAVLECFGIDFRRVWLGAPQQFRPVVDPVRGTLVDEWGLTWQKIGDYMEMVQPPLRNVTLRRIKDYPFPDPADPGRYEGVEEWARRLYRETEYCVVAGHSMYGVFELGCWLCGFDEFMMNLVADRSLVTTLMDRVLEIQKAIMGRYLDIVGPYVQIIETADDLGQQRGPMISPKLYRSLIKPYHKEYVQYLKTKAPHAKVFMHSCGSVFDLIPDLIDVGIDILNPVQPRAAKMEPWRLKAAFGRDLTFHGGIDVQAVLPHGSQSEVEAYVRDTIAGLARGGGYILGGSHNIQVDVPPANVVAMYRSALRYGTYPLEVGETP